MSEKTLTTESTEVKYQIWFSDIKEECCAQDINDNWIGWEKDSDGYIRFICDNKPEKFTTSKLMTEDELLEFYPIQPNIERIDIDDEVYKDTTLSEVAANFLYMANNLMFLVSEGGEFVSGDPKIGFIVKIPLKPYNPAIDASDLSLN